MTNYHLYFPEEHQDSMLRRVEIRRNELLKNDNADSATNTTYQIRQSLEIKLEAFQKQNEQTRNFLQEQGLTVNRLTIITTALFPEANHTSIAKLSHEQLLDFLSTKNLEDILAELAKTKPQTTQILKSA